MNPATKRRSSYWGQYKNRFFAKIVSQSPATKHTWGNNDVLIHPFVKEETGELIVITAIDSLTKGAAGGVVHNRNLMPGMPETAGLESLPVYP